MKIFDRQSLQETFAALGERALRDGRCIELSIYEGGAMALLFDVRRVTHDVDAVFEQDQGWVREQALALAAERDWPPNWISEAVQMFLSARDAKSKQLSGMYPSAERCGLRVLTPTPEYLFAMKAMAMRSATKWEPDAQDFADLQLLREALGLQRVEEALDLVGAFYPHGQVAPRTALGLRELFDMAKNASDDAPDPRDAAPGGPSRG